MVNQDLLTVFVALTSAAVLIQTGILIGMFILTRKISAQADRATQQARTLMSGKAITLADQLQSLTARLAEYGLTAQVKVGQFERALDKNELAWHEKLSQWEKKTA